VLIVDDSAVLRQSTRFILERDPELKVVGEARNGEEAVALTRRLRPDVVTMDIRMPRMDGFEAIRHIMAENPVPIVVVTSVDLDREMGVSSQASKLGAVSILRRPARVADSEHKAFTARLIGQVKLMSDVKVVHRPVSRKTTPTPALPLGGREAPTSHLPPAVGVIMTGMGADGAVGMKALREAGAVTIAQDEESYVVFGMPKEAITLGAIQHIVPLEKVAQTIVAFCNVKRDA